MRKLIFLSIVAMAVFGSLAMLPVDAVYAQSVCYKWSAFPAERYRLDVRPHSPLGPGQFAFSVHGKEVGACGAETMVAVTGTVVRKLSPPPRGVHMGLEVHASRGVGVEDTCRSIEVDCTAPGVSVTPPTWFCKSRNEFDVFHGASTLTLVADAPCAFFQDGTALAPEGVGVGPASGLKKAE